VPARYWGPFLKHWEFGRDLLILTAWQCQTRVSGVSRIRVHWFHSIWRQN
jgi:hypothetical protein